MDTMSRFKNDPNPLLRAAYWLVVYSWEDQGVFEILQDLAAELQDIAEAEGIPFSGTQEGE